MEALGRILGLPSRRHSLLSASRHHTAIDQRDIRRYVQHSRPFGIDVHGDTRRPRRRLCRPSAYHGISMARRLTADVGDADGTGRKREKYLILVQAGADALLRDEFSRAGMTSEQKANVLSRYMLNLSIAISAAEKIPSTSSALEAALDVVDHLFNDAHPDDSNPDRSWLINIQGGKARKYRASWAGMMPRSHRLKLMEHRHLETKRIDGKMRLEKPSWHGLPFNDSLTLEALSWIRSEDKIFLTELRAQMPKIDPDHLGRRLKTLESHGWVTSDREPDGAITLQATSQLLMTVRAQARQPRLPKPVFATPTEKYHARTRAARIERMAKVHRWPGARKILNTIKRNGSMQLKDLNPLVPQFERLGLRCFMMELREAGWVECVGRGGGAAWVGTQKLVGKERGLDLGGTPRE